MKGDRIKVTRIDVEATCGSHVGQCIAEGICLSLEEGVDVFLIHNGRQYIISGNKIVDKINCQHKS